EEQLVVAGLVELDHAPVAVADRRGAESRRALALDQLGHVLLLAADADRAAHALAEREEVAAITRAHDREPRRQSDLGDHEGGAPGLADRHRTRPVEHDVLHDLVVPDQRGSQRHPGHARTAIIPQELPRANSRGALPANDRRPWVTTALLPRSA